MNIDNNWRVKHEYYIDAEGNSCRIEIYPDGDKTYLLLPNNILHRLDGPAIDWKGTLKNIYFVRGKCVRAETQQEFERLMRMKAFW